MAELGEFKSARHLFRFADPERVQVAYKVTIVERLDSPMYIDWPKLSDSKVEKLLFNLKEYSFVLRDAQEKITRKKLFSLHLPKLESQILTLVHEHNRINISDIVTMTQANRNTIKKHLAALVTNSKIVKHGKGKATWYTLP